MNQLQPRVTIVTVNWNRPNDTIDCLISLHELVYSNTEIVVVDNGSTDNSVELIRDAFPGIEIIEIPENVGFARGYNTGMRYALEKETEYIWMLNNDTVVDPNSLQYLINEIEPDVAVIAPAMLFFDDKDVIWSVGGMVNQWNLEQKRINIDPYDKFMNPFDVDFVPACSLLMPKSTLNVVGLFDENFKYLYYEDSDHCRRIQDMGLRIKIVPRAKIWHKVAQTSGGLDTPRERYSMARSSIKFFKKHTRGIHIPIVIFWRTGSAVKTSLRLVFKGKFKSLFAYWKGLFQGLMDK